MTPAFTAESVEREKGIIGQEILMCEDDPYERCFLNLISGLYEKNPIRIDIAGSIKSISKIDDEILRICHKRFYTPANMILIVCGNLALDSVMKSVDDYFIKQNYQDGKRNQRRSVQERKGVNFHSISAKMPVERPMFILGFKDNNAPESGRELLKRQMLSEILNELIFSSSGELYTDLYERRIMTTPFSFGTEYGKTYAMAYVGGECDDPELVKKEIDIYINKLKSEGVSRSDFTRRKKMTYSSGIKLFDSTWEIASAILDDALLNVEIFEEFQVVNELTPEDADKLLEELYCVENETFSTIVPKNKQKR
jgi:predicted Zn-dependent peptidase